MATTETAHGRLTSLRVAALALDKTDQLRAQECGHRQAALRRQDAGFSKRLFVQSQRDVASGHDEYGST
jgi:hypothetical protein